MTVETYVPSSDTTAKTRTPAALRGKVGAFRRADIGETE